jgi:hypothetical protein
LVLDSDVHLGLESCAADASTRSLV